VGPVSLWVLHRRYSYVRLEILESKSLAIVKPRARGITIGAATLVALVVAVLVVANWGSVRDHVEAWHFQLTRKTISTEPCPFILIFDSEDFPEDWGNFYNDLL